MLYCIALHCTFTNHRTVSQEQNKKAWTSLFHAEHQKTSGGMSSLASPVTRQRTLFQNSNEDRKKREGATLRKMDEVTSEYLEKMDENSSFFFGARRSGNIGDGDGNRTNVVCSEISNKGKEKGDEHSNSKNNTCCGIVVPRFEPNEIELETTIGMGEFGVVMVGTVSLNSRLDDQHNDVNGEGTTTIESQHPNPSSSDAAPVLWLTTEQNHVDTVETDRILRDELAKSCRQRQSRGSSDEKSSPLIERSPISSSSDIPANSLLVIKQIRKDLYPKKRIEAAKDLAREAKLLARLQQLYFLEEQQSSEDQQHPYHHHTNTTYRSNHPNLITLRGIVSNPGSPEFGIILDRLHLTLAELANSWGKRQQLILETLTTTRSKKHSFLSLVQPQWWVSPDQLVGAVTQKVGGWFQREDHHPEVGSENPVEEADFAEQASAIATTTSPESLLLLGERILALWDVSEGMGHLHDHKILYRDLKTENVGRTVRSGDRGGGILAEGDRGNASFSRNDDVLEHQRMQIFDFGLAKECKPLDKTSRSPKTSSATLETTACGHDTDDSEDTGSFYDNYKMTGMTGTMRIMAPEVIRCLPYGLPVDVYSFGICMWEVFTGTKCNFLSAAEICDAKHTVRPELPMIFDTEKGSVGMPKKLQKLMQNCWHEDPKKRPAFSKISKTLLSILAGIYRQSMRPQEKQHQQQQGQQNYRYDHYQVTPGNVGSGFWNKIHKPKKQQQQPATLYGCLDATSLSDQAGFWPRLKTIRASGLLDES